MTRMTLVIGSIILLDRISDQASVEAFSEVVNGFGQCLFDLNPSSWPG